MGRSQLILSSEVSICQMVPQAADGHGLPNLLRACCRQAPLAKNPIVSKPHAATLKLQAAPEQPTRPARLSSTDIVLTKKVLGHGGFAKVFYGRTKGMAAAMKVPREDSKESRSALHKEATLTHVCGVRDTSIIGVLGYMAEPYPVLVLELCQGSLNDIRSTMTPSFFVKAFDAASSALQTLEKLCIAHRDVAPSNFFIKGQQVLLGEIECATCLTSCSTTTYEVAGTPAYWSAECWGALMKQAPHTPRLSDVYALGQTFTELSEASGVRRWRNSDKLRKTLRPLTLPEPVRGSICVAQERIKKLAPWVPIRPWR